MPKIVSPPPMQDFSIFIGYIASNYIEYDSKVAGVQRIFETKRKELEHKIQHLKDDESYELEEGLYRSRVYNVFGEFDLCTLSLIEGYSLGSRVNTGANFLLQASDSSSGHNFDFPNNTYQSHNSIGASYKKRAFFDQDIDVNSLESINGLMLNNSGSPEFVLLGIQQVKLNGFVLSALGNTLIKATCLAIDYQLRRKQKERTSKDPIYKGFDYLIVHRSNWADLNILFFSNSYEVIDTFNHEINSYSLEALEVQLEVIVNDSKVSQLISEEARQYIKDLKKGGLCLKCSKTNCHCMASAPLFIKTNTVLGYDNRIVGDKKILDKIDPNCHVYPVTHWMVSSSEMDEINKSVNDELQKFIDTFRGNPEKKEEKIWGRRDTIPKNYATYGRDDLTTYYGKSQTKTFIEFQSKIIGEKTSIKNKLIDSTYTVISTDREQKSEAPVVKANRPEISAFKASKNIIKTSLAFRNEDVRDLKACMKNLLVPHQLKDSLLRVYSNYLNYLDDDVMCFTYLELYPALKLLVSDLRAINQWYLAGQPNEEPKTVFALNQDVLHEELYNLADAFHFALHNRQSSSYNTRELFDSNIFHSHSVMDKISSLDFLYKSACHILGNPQSFLYVASFQKFSIENTFLKLNKSHIYMPELLASAYINEVANQLSLQVDIMDKNQEVFIFHKDDTGGGRETELNLNAALKEVELKRGGLYRRDWSIFMSKSIHNDGLRSVFDNLDDLLTYREKFDANFFKHIFNDIIGFKYIYEPTSNPHKIFRYWFWMGFLTHSEVYEYQKDIKMHLLRTPYVERMLLRYYIVCHFCIPNYYQPSDDAFFAAILKDRCQGDHEDYLKQAKAIVSFYFKAEGSIFENWGNKVVKFVENEFKRKSADQQDVNIYKLCSSIESRIDLKENFLEGRDLVFKFKANTYDINNLTFEVKYFLKAQVLSSVFLETMYDEAYKDTSFSRVSEEHCHLIMKLKNIDENIINQSEFGYAMNYEHVLGNANIIADPAGGIHIMNPESRRKVFKLRNLYYRYLYDLASRYKYSYIKDLL